MTESPRTATVVVPVFNEHETLRTLRDGIVAACEGAGVAPQIVFVDDGSTDPSWSVMAALAAEDARVTAIRLRRNFGKAAALAAGFEVAESPIVLTMDADLQDDPQEIPRFIAQLDAGLDVVSGWKQVRHDPWHKIWPSRAFNALVGALTGVRIHDHNCGFKAYRRAVLHEVHLYGELHRFIPVLAASRGWQVGEIDVLHHPRRFGHSKYGARRIVKGFLDLMTVYFLTGYGQRPLHLIGSVGLLGLIFGTLGLVLLTAWWFVSRMFAAIEPIHLHERAIFYFSIVALLFGSQLLVAGLLAEMLTALARPSTPPYSVAERLGGGASPLGSSSFDSGRGAATVESEAESER